MHDITILIPLLGILVQPCEAQFPAPPRQNQPPATAAGSTPAAEAPSPFVVDNRWGLPAGLQFAGPRWVTHGPSVEQAAASSIVHTIERELVPVCGGHDAGISLGCRASSERPGALFFDAQCRSVLIPPEQRNRTKIITFNELVDHANRHWLQLQAGHFPTTFRARLTQDKGSFDINYYLVDNIMARLCPTRTQQPVTTAGLPAGTNGLPAVHPLIFQRYSHFHMLLYWTYRVASEVADTVRNETGMQTTLDAIIRRLADPTVLPPYNSAKRVQARADALSA